MIMHVNAADAQQFSQPRVAAFGIHEMQMRMILGRCARSSPMKL